MAKVITIEELSYELYKIDWMRRISADTQSNTLKNYYQEIEPEDRDTYTYDEYVWEYGYAGQLYVDFDEFLCNEYQDDEYMKTLLVNGNLIAEYLGTVSKYKI